MDFLIEHAVAIAIVCGIAGAVYGLLLTRWVLSQPDGDDRMREIAAAIQEGAAAYLKRQYTTIAGVAVIVFVIIAVAGAWTDDLGIKVAIGFLIGAVLSALTGFIGMNVAVRSNVRTAEAAKSGLKPALNVAFRAGSVTSRMSLASRSVMKPEFTLSRTGSKAIVPSLDSSPASCPFLLIGLIEL